MLASLDKNGEKISTFIEKTNFIVLNIRLNKMTKKKNSDYR